MSYSQQRYDPDTPLDLSPTSNLQFNQPAAPSLFCDSFNPETTGDYDFTKTIEAYSHYLYSSGGHPDMPFPLQFVPIVVTAASPPPLVMTPFNEQSMNLIAKSTNNKGTGTESSLFNYKQSMLDDLRQRNAPDFPNNQFAMGSNIVAQEGKVDPNQWRRQQLKKESNKKSREMKRIKEQDLAFRVALLEKLNADLVTRLQANSKCQACRALL